MKFDHLEAVSSMAIVGGTGLVGREILSILAEARINIREIRLLASSDSYGEVVEAGGREFSVDELSSRSFENIEVALFSVPNDVTRKFVPDAIRAGALVMDDSSEYRMDPEVPLIIPQVNGALLRNFMGKLMATPNCTVTPLAMALKPLQDHFGVKRVVVSTYQSVSGAGKSATDELSAQSAALLNGSESPILIFPHRIAFNCLPMIGRLAENGNSEEEEKMVRETRKILDLPQLGVSASAVRVPTFCGHGMTVHVELLKSVSRLEEVREILSAFPGLCLMDNPSSNQYPTNLDSVGSDEVHIGRIRRDTSVPSGLNFWVIADNLRKGAALNMLESLDLLYRYRRMS